MQRAISRLSSRRQVVSTLIKAAYCVNLRASIVLAGALVIALMAPAVAAQTTAWVWANPTPHGNNLYAATTGNGVSVAVGGVGTLFSNAGGSWAAQQAPTNNNLFTVTYGGGLFVAAGQSDTIITSADGVHWTLVPVTDTSQSLFSVAFGNNTFVAVGSNGTVFTSTGNSSWSEAQIASGLTITGVAYGASEFVAVAHWTNGATQIYYSPTGTGWTLATLPQIPTDSAVLVAWNGSEFLAMGLNAQGATGASVITSVDGKNWSVRTAMAPKTAFPISLTTDGPNFIAMLQSGPDATATTTPILIERSSDGTTWNTLAANTIPATWSQIIPRQVTYTGSEYLAVGTSGYIATSTDLVNWTIVSPDKALTYEHLRGIHWLGGRFYAVGDNDTILTSTDGSAWTSQAVSVAAASNLRDIASNGSQYVVVGSNGVVLTSTDGSSWNATTISPAVPAGTILQGLTWNGKLYVAVGTGGAIYTSPDGLTWSAQTSGTVDNLWNVAWTGSMFVVTSDDITGDGVRILASMDGAHWASVPFNSGNATSLYGLHWNGTGLIASGSAVNSAGAIVAIIGTSSDGKTWNVDYSTVKDTFADAILSGQDEYAAVGLKTGNLYTSTDGVTWAMQQPPIQSAGMQNIATDCGVRVATGYAGVILYNAVQPPTASNGQVSTAENTPIGATLQACGGTLSFAIETQPAHGTVSVNDASTGAFTYTPITGFSGTDSFAFTASNSVGVSVPAVETITVNLAAPTAVSGSVITAENTAVSGTLGASGAATSFAIQSNPVHGKVVLTDSNTGAFTYTPATGFTGTDSFTFTASNATGTSSPAMESVTVNAAGTGGSGGSTGRSGSGGGGGAMNIGGLLALSAFLLLRRRYQYKFL